MLQKYLPVFIIFLFGVMGCASWESIESTKVSSTEIYQDYVIEGSKDRTTVTATFRVGGGTGSTVDLDAPSKILHNGKEMSESGAGFMKGTDYHDSADNFVANHKFVYTDASGKTWQNEISCEPLEMTVKDINISKTNGATITLSRPVAEDEFFDFTLTSETDPPPATNSNSNSNNTTPEKVYSVTLPRDLDASRTAIKIEPSALMKNFVDGKAFLSLMLMKNGTIQHSARGGSIRFSYTAQKVAVNVVN